MRAQLADAKAAAARAVEEAEAAAEKAAEMEAKAAIIVAEAEATVAESRDDALQANMQLAEAQAATAEAVAEAKALAAASRDNVLEAGHQLTDGQVPMAMTAVEVEAAVAKAVAEAEAKAAKSSQYNALLEAAAEKAVAEAEAKAEKAAAEAEARADKAVANAEAKAAKAVAEAEATVAESRDDALHANVQLADVQAAASEIEADLRARVAAVEEERARLAEALEAAEISRTLPLPSEVSRTLPLPGEGSPRAEGQRAREHALAAEAEAARAEAEVLEERVAALQRELATRAVSERYALQLMSCELTQRQAAANTSMELLERRAATLAGIKEAAEDMVADGGSLRRRARDEETRVARRELRERALADLAEALFAEGMRCNGVGDAEAARYFFEQAYVLQPRSKHLLSLGNMSLKLGQREAAAEVYRRVVAAAANGAAEPAVDQYLGTVEPSQPRLAPPSEKELAMAERKLAEALRDIADEEQCSSIKDSAFDSTLPAVATELSGTILREAGVIEQSVTEELQMERQLRLRLSQELARLLPAHRAPEDAKSIDAGGGSDSGGGDGTCDGGGGPTSQKPVGSQLEQLVTQLHRAKAETAKAMNEISVLEGKLAHQAHDGDPAITPFITTL